VRTSAHGRQKIAKKSESRSARRAADGLPDGNFRFFGEQAHKARARSEPLRVADRSSHAMIWDLNEFHVENCQPAPLTR
jgi:hypothetical protein